MTTAEAIRNKVRRAPAGTFMRPSDFPGPRAAVLVVLSRLHAKGDLIRVRNGLYWKGVNSPYGKGSPDLLASAMAAAGERGVGPSGWSATHALGLSTQMPAIPELAVTGPAPKFEGVRFHTRNNATRRGLSFYELALLEALREFPRFAEVDIAEVARKVADLEAKGKIRMAKVEKVAAREHSPRLRENLAIVRELLHALKNAA